MGGRATLLVVLLLVATCAWASPISRDNRQAASEAPQGPAVSVSTQSPSVAKNETSSRDAPKPAQSSAVAAEKEETESPVTEAADSLKKETVVSVPVEAAEKVAVAAAVEEAKDDSPVTEKEETEKIAFPAEVEKINEKSPVSKKVEAEKVAISAEVEEAKEESPVTEKGEAEKVAVPAEVEKANEKSPVSKKEKAEKVAVSAEVEEAKEESTVSEKVEVKKVEVAAEKESTIVEKADVIEQSETIISEEVTTSAPIDEGKVVEKASPSSPQEPEIAEEVTTVSPAADEEIIDERLRSSQVESDALEKTEKSKIEVESSKQKEKETKPLQDAAPIAEKSIDRAKTRDEEQSPATEAVPAAAADKVKVKRIPVDDVAAAFEEETVVTEAAIEATTVFEEEGHEKVEATTTPFPDSSDREDATEDPSDRIAAESSGIEIVTAISVESEDGSFRQGDIDITEAPEGEDISSTTAIPQSEQDIDAEIRGDDETTVEPSTETPIDRMDSSTDIIFVDVTTERSEKTTEELIQAESLLRNIEVEEDSATDAPEAEKEESDSIDRRDDGAQAITTEATLEETTVIASSQSFDDAAQIKVVEIKESSKPVESIVPADSAPIEIVEITEKPQLLAKDKAEEKAQALNKKKSPSLEQEIFQTTEIIPGEEEATTIESQSPAIRDKQEKPSSSGSEQDQEPEEEEEKPNSSKIQPAPAEDYWLSMKAEGNKSALVPAKPAESSSNADEVAVEAVEEAKDVDVNIRGGDNLTSTAVAAPSAVVTPASVVSPAAAVAQESSIDDEIAKVAQKYGLQSVGKITTEQKPVEQVASDTQVVVSDADVPKADSIYLGNESKKSDFQESNDLQRRHSFGDKVVRFVRSFL